MLAYLCSMANSNMRTGKGVWDRLADLRQVEWILMKVRWLWRNRSSVERFLSGLFAVGTVVLGFFSDLNPAISITLGAVSFAAIASGAAGIAILQEKLHSQDNSTHDLEEEPPVAGPRLAPCSLDEADWFTKSRYLDWRSVDSQTAEKGADIEGRYHIGIENAGPEFTSNVRCWLRAVRGYYRGLGSNGADVRSSYTPPGSVFELTPADGSPTDLNPGDEALFYVASLKVPSDKDSGHVRLELPWSKAPSLELRTFATFEFGLRATSSASLSIDFGVRIALPSEETFSFELYTE